MFRYAIQSPASCGRALYTWLTPCSHCIFVFSFKQKTAYEMRISDWSSDVCSSDLPGDVGARGGAALCADAGGSERLLSGVGQPDDRGARARGLDLGGRSRRSGALAALRSEEHTSELQSLMRISYAVFCLKQKTTYYTRSDVHTMNGCTQLKTQND